MRPRILALLAIAAVLAATAGVPPAPASRALAATGSVEAVVIGTFQPAVSGGACEAWSEDCVATRMAGDGEQVAVTLSLPAGEWRWRVAVIPTGGAPSTSVGVGTRPDGDDRVLQLASPTEVTFVFDGRRNVAAASADEAFVFAWHLPAPCEAEGPPPPPVDPTAVLFDPDGDGVSTAVVDVPAGGCLRVADGDRSQAWSVEPQGVTGPVEIAFDPRAQVPATARPAGPPGADGHLDPLGFAHDSRDLAFRSPAGASPAGSPIRLRFRTFHDDATGVELVVFDAVANERTRIPMEMVASGVACGEEPVDTVAACDWWEALVTPADPTTLGYRFEVADGDAEAYYADDGLLDGGRGVATRTAVDNGFIVTVHVPGVEPLPWLDGAVVYQVFPDRFRNGDPSNDVDVDDPRYAWPDDETDRNERRAWDQLPESPGRGRDWFGGDLAGIRANLPYLADLGVDVLYLNPIFAAGSNHLYDTRDYTVIDPRFGTLADWEALVADAGEQGIRVIVDGVFNHVSSDSPYFDRYGHFDGPPGACESVESPYRAWFTFRPANGAACAGPDGPNTMEYVAWAGYASLPVLVKAEAGVRALVYEGDDAVARQWLRAGAAGWRLDVMMDASFPDDFWPAFRAAVKATDPEAAIVGELWQRDQVLPKVRGDTADTTMDYRFRNAVLGFLGRVDGEGFPDSGASDQPPSLLARKLLSIAEDYPAFAARTAWSLLGTHDTERALWSLTPGEREDRERPANLAAGKARLRLASLLQFTLPGAPTIYYGDEVGMTGADDPDDRRTFPLLGADGSLPPTADAALRDWYKGLAGTRRSVAVLRDGELRFLVANDGDRTVAFSRYDDAGGLAVVALNPDPEREATIAIPMADARGAGTPVPDGVQLTDVAPGSRDTAEVLTVADGRLTVTLPPLGAALLVPVAGADLVPPAAPTGLEVVPGDVVRLAWQPTPDAARYRVERAAFADGPATVVGEPTAPELADPDAPPTDAVYLVRAIDAAGNVGPAATLDVPVAGPTATPQPSAAPDGGSPGDGGTGAVPLALTAVGGILLAGAVIVVIRRRSTRR
ncbi:MAG: alpha-amylase family glycosyl hydrolase [Chloroflexi bacterium]|nr:alpha-amylase family glycosyl hydrolase [Chloroflexota bacterium]